MPALFSLLLSETIADYIELKYVYSPLPYIAQLFYMKIGGGAARMLTVHVCGQKLCLPMVAGLD